MTIHTKIRGSKPDKWNEFAADIAKETEERKCSCGCLIPKGSAFCPNCGPDLDGTDPVDQFVGSVIRIDHVISPLHLLMKQAYYDNFDIGVEAAQRFSVARLLQNKRERGRAGELP